MPISPLLNNSPFTSTGVVLVIYRDPDAPATTTAVIERCGNTANAPDGVWAQIGELPNCDVAGSSFIDYLPATPTKYWYRAKHTSLGFNDSLYVFEVSASAVQLPDVDFNTKPWLLNTVPLQLDMVISSETPTTWIVSSSVSQPVTGPTLTIPTLSVVSSANVGTVTNNNNGTFTVVKSSAYTTAGHVIIQNTLSGFLNGRDRVQLVSTSDLAALSIRTEQVGLFTYNCRVTDPVPASTITVTLNAVNCTVTPSIFTTTSDTLFSFTVTPTTSGDGRITIRATSPRRTEGIDAIDVTALNDNRNATVQFEGSQVTNLGIPFFSFRSLAGSTTRDVEAWVTDNFTAPAATQSLDYNVISRKGYQLPYSPFTRINTAIETTWFTEAFATKASSWLTVSLVPIDSNGRIGTIVNRLFPIPANPVGNPPNQFTARANTSTTSTSTTNTVTMPASNLPTLIRVYRDGTAIGDVTVTAGASVAQTIVHTGLSPSTSYTWEYAGVNTDAEQTRFTSLSVTTTAATLLAPSGSSAGMVEGRLRFTITNESEYPYGTTFNGQYNIGGSNLELTPITSTTLESPETYSSVTSGVVRFRAANSNYTMSPYSSDVAFTSGGNLQ